jgi:hypothetical protein
MNPALRDRAAAGTFARVTLDGDTPFTGYIGGDPAAPDFFRMDGYVLGAGGHLEAISIRLAADDIRHIHFLPEPPEFIDGDGHSIRMEAGFLPALD